MSRNNQRIPRAQSAFLAHTIAKPVIAVVMSVSGSRKTTVSLLLAGILDCKLQEGDDLHPPENIEKIREGMPLTDADRLPWLRKIAHQLEMCGQLRAYAKEAKRNGLAVVVWSYPRGESLRKEEESAIDVIRYAVQIAAPLGAHIIKVKLPTAHIERDDACKVYEERYISIAAPADRVRHIVECAFAGRRMIIFSCGIAIFDDAKFLDEIRAIWVGGEFGSIFGRNSFQRPKDEALRLPSAVMDIYAATPDAARLH